MHEYKCNIHFEITKSLKWKDLPSQMKNGFNVYSMEYKPNDFIAYLDKYAVAFFNITHDNFNEWVQYLFKKLEDGADNIDINIICS
jgi:predicted ATP-grasp superfamily ATP-dependent carboligase